MKVIHSIFIWVLIIFPVTIYANSSECWVEDSDIRGTYEGDCKDGKANGVGLSTGEDTYKGEFKNGKQHGKGVYTWAHGARYEGDWVDGDRTGKGKWKSACGSSSGCDYYDGDYVNGHFDGFGTHSYRCNCSVWECNRCNDHGIFKKGKFIARAPSDVTSVEEYNIWKKRENQRQNAKRISDKNKARQFRDNLSSGDESSVGIIIEVKGNIAKVQTNQSQCTQRNNEGNCLNWISTPVEKWIKKKELYPAN